MIGLVDGCVVFEIGRQWLIDERWREALLGVVWKIVDGSGINCNKKLMLGGQEW